MENPRWRHRVVETEELHDGIPLTPNNVNSQSHHPTRPARWSIGWLAPTLIIGLFAFAITLAIGHYSYFQYLHLKSVRETVPQDWNNSIAIAFTRIFSWALVGSVAAAYTQLLWWYLRRKPLRATTVDALFAIISSPVNLLKSNVVKSATVLWFIALLAPLIPIVTTLPPGALIVHNLRYLAEREQKVSTLDVDFRGNKSAVELFKHMMFSVGGDGEYRLDLSNPLLPLLFLVFL
ncbi:hypothetical protein FOQG_17689 [Fusarium oxysporum f. sp. raphani 54005]|uniref:Uncharacterized protein n=1 Tax=Fusarium oxysporum f. sp. raphani 54005 TaxID=1089458 RepID=X0BGL2_FUSOX|nr:hypothetical protein FOQG_17689 [Fusarium oxysporum f. sp. raphani 54005]